MSCPAGVVQAACLKDGGSGVPIYKPSLLPENLEIVERLSRMAYSTPTKDFLGVYYLEVPGGGDVMLAPRKLVNFGPQDALYVAGLSEFDDSGVMMWGSGDTEQEAFENLRRTAARIVAAIRNPPDLSAVIAAAHAVKDRIESCRLVAGTGDGGDQVIDNFIENGYTLLDFSGYEGYHSLYNSESDDWVLLPTDGALHNYAKLALEMRARGGAILSREDVEWALLCGRSVTPEQMLAYPDLVARYGLDFA